MGTLGMFSQNYHGKKSLVITHNCYSIYMHFWLLSILIHKNIMKISKWRCLHAGCCTVLIYKMRVTIECKQKTCFTNCEACGWPNFDKVIILWRSIRWYNKRQLIMLLELKHIIHKCFNNMPCLQLKAYTLNFLR